MSRWLIMAAVAIGLTGPVQAAGISGRYLEARTCDVWTGPCFANAEMNLSGKNAVLVWRVDKGALGDVRLDGLSIVAVVSASDTLGLQQTGPAQAILIVDEKANRAQRDALIRLAKTEGGELTRRVIRVEDAKVNLDVDCCKEGGCARLEAGKARITTRCLDHRHDKACGNESAFYPPLSKNVHAEPAVAVQHSFTGKGFNQTWSDTERRGAYIGSFELP